MLFQQFFWPILCIFFSNYFTYIHISLITLHKQKIFFQDFLKFIQTLTTIMLVMCEDSSKERMRCYGMKFYSFHPIPLYRSLKC